MSAAPPGPTRKERFLYGIARTAVVVVCGPLWRPKVINREKIPKAGAYVLAPSHRSFLDTPFLAFVTRRRIRYMGKAELWKYGWSTRILDALGGFPVERGAPDRSALNSALDAVRGGEPLAMFPEGTRRRGPVVEDLHDGVAYVAAKAGVPIVPVGIGGSEHILARGRKIPTFSRVVLIIGDPIRPPEREGPVRRGDVASLTATLTERIQTLFTEAETALRS